MTDEQNWVQESDHRYKYRPGKTGVQFGEIHREEDTPAGWTADSRKLDGRLVKGLTKTEAMNIIEKRSESSAGRCFLCSAALRSVEKTGELICTQEGLRHSDPPAW